MLVGAVAVGVWVRPRWLEWNPLRRGAPVRLTAAGVVVDAMRPRDSHEEGAVERRRAVTIERRPLWFVAPDDLILMKLKAGRPRDFEDAVGVLIVQREILDEPYMTEWARGWGSLTSWPMCFDRAAHHEPASSAIGAGVRKPAE